MKKIVYLSIIVLGFFWGGFYYVANKGVELDPMLTQHIKEEYNTNHISKRLLRSIETLDLSNKDLTSIQGIEALINLRALNLSGNLLTDATPLARLEHLTTLDLSFNQLTNVELTSSHLKKIDLEANRLVSIEFMEQLEQLENINLRANKVIDLTPLQSLHKLKKLNIRGNQVQSLESLENLTKLVDLNARNNRITSVAPIANLPLEKRIYLNGNDIQNLHLFKGRFGEFDDYDFEIPIPRPEFRVKSGVYAEPFNLELRTEKDHLIYYTFDGSMPSFQSHRYEEPIKISKQLMLEQRMNANAKTSMLREGFSFEPEDVKKAVVVTAASFDGVTFGQPESHTYIMEEDLFESELPVVSLVVQPKDFFDEEGGIYVPGNMYREGYDLTGNYYQRGREYEKEGSLEYFNEDGSINLRQMVGLRINGSYTRMLPQKSLRIYPRSDYGQSRLYAKFFEDLPYYEFNRLVLRNSGNDNDSTMMRDGLMHELVKERGIDVQGYAPVIVLLNGEYWGIHNIREKFTDDYIDVNYNVKKSDLVMMTVRSRKGMHYTADVGTEKDLNHYEEMMAYIRLNDMTKAEHVEYVNTQMDIDNFLEYVAYQVYYGNTDSFHNNTSIWRKRTDYVPNAPLGHDGRWRWMLFDLDWGMGYGLLGAQGDPMTYNLLNHLMSDEKSVELFKLLMENKGLKDQFAEKMLTLLNENFSPENVHGKIDELAAKIRPEMPASIKRWENIESMEVWEDNVKVLHQFADERPAAIKEHLKETFGYTDDELKELESTVND